MIMKVQFGFLVYIFVLELNQTYYCTQNNCPSACGCVFMCRRMNGVIARDPNKMSGLIKFDICRKMTVSPVKFLNFLNLLFCTGIYNNPPKFTLISKKK